MKVKNNVVDSMTMRYTDSLGNPHDNVAMTFVSFNSALGIIVYTAPAATYDNFSVLKFKISTLINGDAAYSSDNFELTIGTTANTANNKIKFVADAITVWTVDNVDKGAGASTTFYFNFTTV